MRKSLQLRDRAWRGTVRRRFRRRVWQHQRRIWACKGKRILPLARRSEALSLVRVLAPSELRLGRSDHRSKLIRFLGKLRSLFLQRDQAVVIDFRPVTLMEPMGTLLLVAEIDRMIRMAGSAERLSCVLPAAETPRQVLHQIGLLDLLGTQTSHLDTSGYADNVRHWRYATGLTVREDAGTFLDEYEGRMAEPLLEGIWQGISEALVNSGQHAYLGDRNDGCARSRESRWWMFSQEREGSLTVAVCDLGIGIRRSLPLKWDRELVLRFLKDFGGSRRDLAAIRLALEIGQTRTGEGNRGRGLPQIWNVGRAADVGSVTIMSGKGFLSYACDTARETAIEFSTSILGTVIMWTLPLDARLESDE